VLPPRHAATPVVAAAAGVHHTALLLSTGEVCLFGDHTRGQLGREVPHRGNACEVLPEGVGAVAIASGEMHVLALGTDGELYSWGDNQLEQCGRGLGQSVLPSAGRVALPLAEAERVADISAGGYHGAVLTSAGRLFTIGRQIEAGGPEAEADGAGPRLDVAEEEEQEGEEGEGSDGARAGDEEQDGEGEDDEDDVDDAYDQELDRELDLMYARGKQRLEKQRLEMEEEARRLRSETRRLARQIRANQAELRGETPDEEEDDADDDEEVSDEELARLQATTKSVLEASRSRRRRRA